MKINKANLKRQKPERNGLDMAEKQSDKTTVKKLLVIFGKTSFIVSMFLLAVYLFTILRSSGDFYDYSSERSALVEFEESIAVAEKAVDAHYANLYEIVEKLQYSKSREDVEAIIGEYVGSEKFGDLRYYTQGLSYSAIGLPINDDETSGAKLIAELSSSKKPGCTEVYHDSATGNDCMAFFIPVRGSVYVDGILSIIPVRNFINISAALGENDTAVLVVDRKGTVYADALKIEAGVSAGTSIFNFINLFTSDREMVARLDDLISFGKRDAAVLNCADGDYVMVAQPIDALNKNLVFVTMSKCEGIIAPEMAHIRHIINLVIIATVALAVGFAFALFYFKMRKNTQVGGNDADNAAGCPDIEQFIFTANSTLAGKNGDYAIIIFEIRQFQFLVERLSEDMITEIIRYVAKIFDTFTGNHENFGYMGDGKYAILTPYNGENTVRDKHRMVETIVKKHNVFATRKLRNNFNVGVAIAKATDEYNAQDLLNNASVACEYSKNNTNLPYVFYTDTISETREHNTKIEAEMERALENGDFRLFLQPKYNIKNDTLDSAEGLVRWFDPTKGEYRFPGEFLDLFESNGFITKLDHFMYIEALKFLSPSVAKGEKFVPISVNVSLVTFSDPGFLEFYISNKNEYGIPDGAIVIEFTESIAHGDYKTIYKTITELQKNGILCSLDGFGSGYTSLGVLKNVPFDEIKLDRLFLRNGFDQKCDDILFESIVSMAKSLNIRVVQEGVENKEYFDRCAELGVTAIQGFYYAKPLPTEEFKLFANSKTSIKYKALVK